MSTSEAAADERLERFLEAYGPTLARIVASLCPRGGAIDRAEVEQEVRVRLWRVLRSETNVERPASFLYRVAATATIDAARRLRARREEQMEGSASADGPSHMLTLRDARPGPEELLLRAELSDRLARALESLSEDRRTAVKLHLQGFSTAEIAELQGWTAARARNLTSRGMKDLRSRLRKGEPEP